MLIAFVFVSVYALIAFAVLHKWNVDSVKHDVSRHDECMKEIHARLDALEKKHIDMLNLIASLEREFSTLKNDGLVIKVPVKTRRKKDI